MFLFGGQEALQTKHERAVTMVAQLYESIARQSGASLIVDSSKFPTTAFVLSGSDRIDMSLLHLVRDPRGVAFSWSRVKQNRNLDPPVPMKMISPWLSVPQWDLWNLLAEQVGKRIGRYLRVRYEDLVDDPRSVVKKVLAFVDHEVDELDFVAGASAMMAANHMVSGNPSRFDLGNVAIAADIEWEVGMPPSDRLIATLLSAGWRRRYGY
jgi:hypothetical protein